MRRRRHHRIHPFVLTALISHIRLTRQRITEEVRGSTSRTFCRMCGIFVDEVSQEFHRERKAASEKLLEATELALPIVQAITADDATADLNPEAVEQLLGIFQERVTQALALEERIHPTALHAWLKEAITSVIRCAIRTCILPLWPEDAVPGATKEKEKGSRKSQLPLSRSWRSGRIPLGPTTRQLPQSRSFTAYRIPFKPITS